MRDTAKAGALRAAATAAGVSVDVRALDVTDRAPVAACLAGLDRLDALVNNAGAGHLGTLEQESVEDVRAVMEVNFFGVLNVTKAALPLLRQSRGRVLTVTSVGGVVGQPFNEAYCAAKFAVEGFMESLAAVAAAEILALLEAEQPAFRVQTSDAARAFTAVKLADGDGSAVQALTGGWIAQGTPPWRPGRSSRSSRRGAGWRPAPVSATAPPLSYPQTRNS